MLYRERIDILQATLKPISEYGFHNTPMSKTTTEANVGAGTIYRYFEDKKALIKVVIVTGANSGIGYEAARELAKKEATVVMGCRDGQKGQTAAGQIRKEYQAAQVSRCS
jgi:AcrR family transcriptional regulator